MSLKLIIAQVNFLAGDIEGNTQKVIESIQIAENKKADLLIFPELTLTYYPAQDLWLRNDLEDRIQSALSKIQIRTHKLSVIVGYPKKRDGHLYNEAALIQQGNLIATYQKQCLPNYNVFYEKRFFSEGSQPPFIFEIKQHRFSLLICEDLWNPNPIQQIKGADYLISINASPFTYAKHEERIALLKERASTHHISIIYANWIGGQDDLLFDGGSCLVNSEGGLIQQAPFFKELLWEIDLPPQPAHEKFPSPDLPPPPQRIYDALVLGTHDYVKKNHFPSVLLGLSGGVDSALTLAIAVDALGKENVRAIMMPSRFTSQLSLDLALQQAKLLGIQYDVLSIEPMFHCFLNTLNTQEVGIVAENLQARCRGTLLMALSNQTGALVLTTCNKSEIAVGYATIYGDMAGGLSVLKDVYKTCVYELVKIRNQRTPVILPEIIQRHPSAELAHDQKDQDTLPPYPVLDKILIGYIEENKSVLDLVQQGFDEALVRGIIKRIQKSEYKRKQAPVGIKVTARAFGSDWLYPITSKS